jgi:hypothetical protein
VGEVVVDHVGEAFRFYDSSPSPRVSVSTSAILMKSHCVILGHGS